MTSPVTNENRKVRQNQYHRQRNSKQIPKQQRIHHRIDAKIVRLSSNFRRKIKTQRNNQKR